MKKSIILILLSTVLWACSEQSKEKETITNSTKEASMILDNGSIVIEEEETRSLLDSLNKYKNVDKIRGSDFFAGEGSDFFQTFSFNNQRHGITMGDSVKLYKLVNDQFKLIKKFYSSGIRLELQQIDVNGDGQKDLMIELPSGGRYGSDYICLLYDNENQKFVHNANIPFMNSKVNTEKQEITSSIPSKSITYKVKEFEFHKIEERINIGFDNEKYFGFWEITSFDENGNITKVDTVDYNN